MNNNININLKYISTNLYSIINDIIFMKYQLENGGPIYIYIFFIILSHLYIFIIVFNQESVEQIELGNALFLLFIIELLSIRVVFSL